MVGDPRAGVKDFALMLSDDRREVIGQRLLPLFIEEESNRDPRVSEIFFSELIEGAATPRSIWLMRLAVTPTF